MLPDIPFNRISQELPTPVINRMHLKHQIENALALAISEYVKDMAVLGGAIPELAPQPNIRSFAVSYTSLDGNQADVRTFSVSLRE